MFVSLKRLVVIAACTTSGQLAAACLLNDYSVEVEYERSSRVVVGTVMSEHVVPAASDGQFDDGAVYTIKVQQTLRGPSEATIEVFSENSSGRFPMKPKKSYVLFLYEAGGRLIADYCGNSGLTSQKREVLAKLESMRRTSRRDQKPNHGVHPTACAVGAGATATGEFGARRG